MAGSSVALKGGAAIYAAYRKAAAKSIGPGEEYDLVDEFATQLGVRSWYVWRPDTGAGQDATLQATPDSAPARRIDSPAALMFLVSALDRLKNLSDAEVKSIAAETALKGTIGIDLDSPEKIHSISALGNERLRGLELVCLMHAAFQRINAGTNVGVDFSQIWQAAQKMHAARNP
jgi:hypothetical protein